MTRGQDEFHRGLEERCGVCRVSARRPGPAPTAEPSVAISLYACSTPGAYGGVTPASRRFPTSARRARSRWRGCRRQRGIVMTQTTTVPAARAPDDAVRLRLDPHPSRTTVLDGAWWPRSTDAVAELPLLVEAVAGLRGEITHVLLNTAEWDTPHPRRAAVGHRAVRLGWFTSQPAGLVTIMCEYGNDRFDLLVVPPDASQASADIVSTAAADATDKRRTPELLAEIEHSG
ncbi:DUF5994 family protein [Actinoplanes sp. NPDC049548]|uniref:DUF5994 family protein n=1 Tax=Actinoplanes sp. NPDC049548 TaxID=3155152 RepID=UPI003421ACA3